MNKLEGRLCRSVFPWVSRDMNKDLFSHAVKICPKIANQSMKRNDVNIMATLLKLEAIHISDFNRLGKEIWPDHRVCVVRAMACQMLMASGFGPTNDQCFLKMIQDTVADEAGTKKELNLKGWICGYKEDDKSTRFIGISTSGDGFIFNGSGKCHYFIWDFNTNNYKVRG